MPWPPGAFWCMLSRRSGKHPRCALKSGCLDVQRHLLLAELPGATTFSSSQGAQQNGRLRIVKFRRTFAFALGYNGRNFGILAAPFRSVAEATQKIERLSCWTLQASSSLELSNDTE